MRSRTRELRAATVARMNSEIKLSRIPGRSTDDEHTAGQIKQDRIFYHHEKFPDRSVLDPVAHRSSLQRETQRRALIIVVPATVIMRIFASELTAHLRCRQGNIPRSSSWVIFSMYFSVRITLCSFLYYLRTRCGINLFSLRWNGR